MEEKTFSDYWSALRRYRSACLGIFALAMVAVLLTAWLMPPVYRSTATILIEEQEIPADLVRSTITSFAAQRLQTISQRVMTRANLLAIIDKYRLYEKQRRVETTDEIVERMRQDISFQTLSADVIDPRSGHPTQATIAFTLSYDGGDPGLAQKIDNEITSLYLEENLRMRTRQTAEAADFLASEVAQIGTYAAELEQRLSKFKEAHLNELPEYKQMTLQFIEKIESDIKEIDLQLRALQERNFIIDSQIAQTPQESPAMTATGQRVMTATERLKSLRTESVRLSSQYSAKHPDLVKVRQEIQALEREVGKVDNTAEQLKQINQLRTQRASLSEKYADTHPDIAALDRQIAKLENSVESSEPWEKAKPKREAVADNPVYLNLNAQKQSNGLEIAGLTKRKAELKAKLLDYQQRISHSPEVERQYLTLARDWENTNNRYRELKAKQMEAQIAEQLERKSKGERFSVVEPPLFPEKPVKPNRPVILLIGFVLAVFASVGYALVRETLDNTLRTTEQVAALVGVSPLATIPYYALEGEGKLSARAKWGWLLGLVCTMVILLGLAHWFWQPLDVLWFRLIRLFERLSGWQT